MSGNYEYEKYLWNEIMINFSRQNLEKNDIFYFLISKISDAGPILIILANSFFFLNILFQSSLLGYQITTIKFP